MKTNSAGYIGGHTRPHLAQVMMSRVAALRVVIDTAPIHW